MKRFHNLIQMGVNESFSDIHISGDHKIVCRKNGKIVFLNDRYTCEQIDALVLKMLRPHEFEMLRSRLSVDLSRTVNHVRIRVNVFNSTRGLSIAVRLLPGRIPTFNDLNLLPELRDFSELSTGLILVCGATGSGKSSTIAAFLAEINRTRSCHVMTLEDPIEYRFRSENSFIQQRELGQHIQSFDQGLMDVLREDPDVIMVGELREPETIRLTLNAVESGHLVIASLHATNSEDALYRMCNSFPPDAQDMVRVQLSSVLSLLLVQKLEFKRQFGFRVPVLSVLKGVNSVKATIRDNRFAQIESILQTGRRDGMYTMEKYEEEYLNTKSRMTPPSISFRPSAEIADAREYRSPVLTSGGRQPGENTVYRPDLEAARPVPSAVPQNPGPVGPGQYVIEDTSSVEDVISQLKP